MHPDVEALSQDLQVFIDFLLSVGEKHWAHWFEKDAELIRGSDFRGIEGILSAFGGMGSINDLVIHPMNGHKITEEQIQTANVKLESLLSAVAEKAKKLYAEEIDARRRT
ncbi:DUF6966 domain-containing protein [Dickeya fangzhongdai]|uniref:DUF6966 domain-containing protein n=1 Tax=Dickeya fangzhongdai TaxID=1778540 RepID=A0A2K8QLE7_9GAMM|nr:hypothetical protein [Dickeya fangzhongdai]ATZ94331.1 hypothetical protein CVE23_10360 [Dickeya fangzhongdai]QOH47768.1 hypothetical protein DYD82_10410 [Dickeya fangzhongdai]QOH52073.1 hypothetical protein DYD83_10410 [Dickeya fangzhongdai]WOY00723.1 hypothetical protein OGM22_02465 [Dickeya fangzhongdai]WOY04127.1 hypothetical protein OGM21_20175 [Dickeya fangzhongdai]